MLIGLPVGALAGLVYWYYTANTAGAGNMSASPFYSALWGSLLGMISFGSFDDTNDNEEEE
ncbi:hypothetical protein LJC35_00195 [Parabacteroides sp. OttesenSCG-928-N08]|nr:hypothetical protein [Parabacteroides sp. OttesenSCG-928-N08]